jgi:PAS domain S-box-containing protein
MKNSATAALRCLDEPTTPVRAIVSDYQMPEMDGLEFLRAVREEYPSLPFILYTGKGSEEIASRALDAGATGYLQKGGSEQLRRLAHRVEYAIGEYKTHNAATRYADVLEEVTFPAYVTDEAGRFQFVTEAFAELTGYSRETLTDSHASLVKPEESMATVETHIRSVLSDDDRERTQFDVEMRTESGERLRCRDYLTVLTRGGTFQGTYGILSLLSEPTE